MSLETMLSCYDTVEVTAMDYYTDIFRLGSGLIQRTNEPVGDDYKTKPIIYFKNNDSEHGHYRLLFEDTFQENLEMSYSYDFAITCGVTFFGRRNTLEHASKCYCLIVDLDGVTERTLFRLLEPAFNNPDLLIYPLPNYINLSGRNIHLTWIFDKPIDLFPFIKVQLKNLKYGLIKKVWNPYTSTIEQPQVGSLVQGFRPVWAKTKYAGVRVRCFKTPAKHWSVHALNQFVAPEYRLDLSKRFKDSQMTLEEASIRYPDWYRRIQEKERQSTKGRWHINRALYDWGVRKVASEATYHHRYFSLMLVASLAIKCSFYDPKHNPNPVTYTELLNDIKRLRPILDRVKPDYPMTDSDIKSALECYDISFTTFPREDFERLTAISMPPSIRRNYRPQSTHLAIARSTKQVLKMSGVHIKEGRPTKEKQIKEYASKYPNKSNREIAVDLGISRNTVNKWLKK